MKRAAAKPHFAVYSCNGGVGLIAIDEQASLRKASSLVDNPC